MSSISTYSDVAQAEKKILSTTIIIFLCARVLNSMEEVK